MRRGVPAVTVGAIDLGLVHLRDAWRIGAEAIIPIDRPSGKGFGLDGLDQFLSL